MEDRRSNLISFNEKLIIIIFRGFSRKSVRAVCLVELFGEAVHWSYSVGAVRWSYSLELLGRASLVRRFGRAVPEVIPSSMWSNAVNDDSHCQQQLAMWTNFFESIDVGRLLGGIQFVSYELWPTTGGCPSRSIEEYHLPNCHVHCSTVRHKRIPLRSKSAATHSTANALHRLLPHQPQRGCILAVRLFSKILNRLSLQEQIVRLMISS